MEIVFLGTGLVAVCMAFYNMWIIDDRMAAQILKVINFRTAPMKDDIADIKRDVKILRDEVDAAMRRLSDFADMESDLLSACGQMDKRLEKLEARRTRKKKEESSAS